MDIFTYAMAKRHASKNGLTPEIYPEQNDIVLFSQSEFDDTDVSDYPAGTMFGIWNDTEITNEEVI